MRHVWTTAFSSVFDWWLSREQHFRLWSNYSNELLVQMLNRSVWFDNYIIIYWWIRTILFVFWSENNFSVYFCHSVNSSESKKMDFQQLNKTYKRWKVGGFTAGLAIGSAMLFGPNMILSFYIGYFSLWPQAPLNCEFYVIQ